MWTPDTLGVGKDEFRGLEKLIILYDQQVDGFLKIAAGLGGSEPAAQNGKVMDVLYGYPVS